MDLIVKRQSKLRRQMHCINNQYFKSNSMSFGLTYFCHICDSVGIVHQFSLVHFNFSESETKEFNLVHCRTLSIQNSGFNGGNLRICEGYCFTFKTSSWKPSLLLKRLYNRIKFHRKQILNYSLMVKTYAYMARRNFRWWVLTLECVILLHNLVCL